MTWQTATPLLPEEGWLRRVRKRPRSEVGADVVVRSISNHPGRAFLTFDSASTPPLEEGNRSILCSFIVEKILLRAQSCCGSAIDHEGLAGDE